MAKNQIESSSTLAHTSNHIPNYNLTTQRGAKRKSHHDKVKSTKSPNDSKNSLEIERMASVASMKEASKSLSTYHGDKILKIRNLNHMANTNGHEAAAATLVDFRPKTSANVSIRKLCKFKNKSIETIVTAIESEKSDCKSIKSDFQEYYQQSKNSSANNSNNSNSTSVHNINANVNGLNDTATATTSAHYFRVNKKSISDPKQLFERKLNDHTNESFNKLNVYKSYLNYSSINPFSSNYDVVNKKKNTELFSDSTYRFNRANSSLSLISQSLDMKKFSVNGNGNGNATQPAAKELKRENTTAEPFNDMDKLTNSYITSKPATSRVFPMNCNNSMNISTVTNANTSNNVNNNNNNNTNNLTNASNNNQKPSLDSLKSQLKILEKNKINTTTNQFLTYRNDENKSSTNSSNNNNNSNTPKKLKDGNDPKTNAITTAKGGKNKENGNKSTTNKLDNLDDYRMNNGPENYLEENKLQLIRKWVQKVNQVQARDGKWGETINKIAFYD